MSFDQFPLDARLANAVVSYVGYLGKAALAHASGSVLSLSARRDFGHAGRGSRIVSGRCHRVVLARAAVGSTSQSGGFGISVRWCL